MALRTVSVIEGTPERPEFIIPIGGSLTSDTIYRLPASAHPVQNPPFTWLIPVAHDTTHPETYSAITAQGGLLASAYDIAHSATGSMSAVVDAGAIASYFGIIPSHLHIYYNGISGGLFMVATWGSCTGITVGDVDGLRSRSQPMWFQNQPHVNISARAVFDAFNQPIGTLAGSTGMVYFGW